MLWRYSEQDLLMDSLWEERSCEIEIKDISFTLPRYLGGKFNRLFTWRGQNDETGVLGISSVI